MARYRRRYRRPLTIILGVALFVGAIAVVFKMLGHEPAANSTESQPLARNDAPIQQVKTTEKTVAPATQPNKKGKVELATLYTQTPTKLDTPATQPTELNNTSKTSGTPPIVLAPVSLPTLFKDVEAKRKDDPIGARAMLVGAIDTKKLTPEQKDEALRVISEINSEVVFSPKKFLKDETATIHAVKPGEVMAKIATNYDVTWQWIGRLNNISDPRKLQSGKSLKIIKGPFHALVSKAHYTVDIYIGKPTEPGAIFLKRFRCGLGENDSTPTGVWQVENKLQNPRYYNPRNEGPRVIEPDDPANPLGERWIGLTGIAGDATGKGSYGVHGTIDPDSIGKKKSMGCIRLLNEDVEWVYDMLIAGKSTVTVVE